MQRAPIFDPSDDRTTTFSQLMSLDMLPARGLPEINFWQLFSKCRICSNFMTTRTVPYHSCATPSKSSLCFPFMFILNNIISVSLDTQPENRDRDSLLCAAKDQYFLKFLDVHGIAGNGGIPESVFRTIFYACIQCGHYMTARLMWDHHEDVDFDDYRCINLAGSSSSESRVTRKALDFPLLGSL